MNLTAHFHLVSRLRKRDAQFKIGTALRFTFIIFVLRVDKFGRGIRSSLTEIWHV